jgi:hypothetical protein
MFCGKIKRNVTLKCRVPYISTAQPTSCLVPFRIFRMNELHFTLFGLRTVEVSLDSHPHMLAPFDRIYAIGDNPKADIRGAKAAGPSQIHALHRCIRIKLFLQHLLSVFIVII